MRARTAAVPVIAFPAAVLASLVLQVRPDAARTHLILGMPRISVVL